MQQRHEAVNLDGEKTDRKKKQYKGETNKEKANRKATRTKSITITSILSCISRLKTNIFTYSLIITQPTNALIVCHLFLNHFFKTLSLLQY